MRRPNLRDANAQAGAGINRKTQRAALRERLLEHFVVVKNLTFLSMIPTVSCITHIVSMAL